MDHSYEEIRIAELDVLVVAVPGNGLAVADDDILSTIDGLAR